jgi:hypothetical protein
VGDAHVVLDDYFLTTGIVEGEVPCRRNGVRRVVVGVVLGMVVVVAMRVVVVLRRAVLAEPAVLPMVFSSACRRVDTMMNRPVR